MNCGTLGTGEFEEGFCLFDDKIDYWDEDSSEALGKVVHHVKEYAGTIALRIE